MATCDDVTGPVSLGNPVEFTMLELANLVLELTGSRSEIKFLPLPVDDPRQRRPDISYAETVLDCRHARCFAKGSARDRLFR